MYAGMAPPPLEALECLGVDDRAEPGPPSAMRRRSPAVPSALLLLAHLLTPAEPRNYTWPIKRAAKIDGDVVLGALMMVHEREDKLTCGPIMPQGGVQALECLLFTLDWVNNNKDFLPGISLGTYVLDDCDKDTYGLEQAVDFIKGSIGNIGDGTYRCPDGSSPRHEKQAVISGVLGAASSVTSIQVANLLRLFKIPQVSYFSTSPELSNKQRFEYFLRTVPSDKNQAHAMVEIIKLLKWTYVSILYEESNYGLKAFNELEDQLKRENICIAIKEKLTKDSGVAAEGSYDAIIIKLLSKQRARGVIVFGSDQEVAGVMRAVRRNNATGHFAWIGSDGWSARSLVFNGNEAQVEGTLSVQPRARPVPGFQEYFLSLTVANNDRNPWFTEFWEDYFQCRWPNSLPTPYNGKYDRPCTGDERLSKRNGFEMERQLQFVSDAVLAFAYALRDMHKAVCGPKYIGLCKDMIPVHGAKLLPFLQNVKFTGLTNDSFQFSKQGDGPARYNILHFKQVRQGDYRWEQVGDYREGILRLNMSQLQFQLGSPSWPASACSAPCPRGWAKNLVEGETCCWHCNPCARYQYLASETHCEECPAGTLPTSDQEGCLPIPEVAMSPASPWATGAMAFSTAGIAATLAVAAVFLRHNDTPVVRASSRELSYVLLGGILLCYAMTFVLVQRPSTIVCGAQKAGLGLCFAVVYSAILTKNNRIARIFRAGRRSARRPGCISPRSQLLICGALVSVQGLVTAAWLVVRPPRAIYYHPTREENMLVCHSSYGPAFGYPLCLVAVCTLYAVLTRKIPEAFNESKYIGFAMYTTCVIWLAFLPIYLTTWKHVVLNLTSTAVAVSLSASVTLACLFVPKLYIILLHPEKNVRSSMMPKYGTLKATATNRVESATQSDVDYEMSDKQRSACSLVSNNSKASCGTQTDGQDTLWDKDVQL
ncbi:metabotropic glutamate receptor 2-like isoform X2 [Ornithodoros turicata]|uniref:metabotropic glutamate receptor 2-like isoform X2 n=1 Tax=Ornithodoros turicata TaxID=34597 RepID=UPI0031386190